MKFGNDIIKVIKTTRSLQILLLFNINLNLFISESYYYDIF